MSKDNRKFENIQLKTSYFEGVVDTLTNYLLENYCPFPDMVDCDIFYIGQNNNTNKSTIIKEKLKTYLDNNNKNSKSSKLNSNSQIEFYQEENNENGNFTNKAIEILKKDYLSIFKGKDYADYSAKMLILGLKEFVKTIDYYLGNPLNFYTVRDKNNIFNEFYFYNITKIFAIEYSEYVILLIFGSDE